jgi:hypothetical protein
MQLDSGVEGKKKKRQKRERIRALSEGGEERARTSEERARPSSGTRKKMNNEA